MRLLRAMKEEKRKQKVSRSYPLLISCNSLFIIFIEGWVAKGGKLSGFESHLSKVKKATEAKEWPTLCRPPKRIFKKTKIVFLKQ